MFARWRSKAIKSDVWQRCSHPPRAIVATMKHTCAAKRRGQTGKTWTSSIESAASSSPGNFARACHARPQTQETASSTALTVCARNRQTCLQRMSGTVGASMRFVQIRIGIAKHRAGIMAQARHHHHRLQACEHCRKCGFHVHYQLRTFRQPATRAQAAPEAAAEVHAGPPFLLQAAAPTIEPMRLRKIGEQSVNF